MKQNIEKYFNELISEKEIDQLEEWTGLKCTDIIFDSNVDNWSVDTSVFNERIIGNKQMVFLIEDSKEEIISKDLFFCIFY